MRSRTAQPDLATDSLPLLNCSEWICAPNFCDTGCKGTEEDLSAGLWCCDPLGTSDYR